MTLAMVFAVSNAFAGYVETNRIPNIKMMTQVDADKSKNHDILINVNDILYIEDNYGTIVLYFKSKSSNPPGIAIPGNIQDFLDKILDKKCINVCSRHRVGNSTVGLYEQPDFAVLRDDKGKINTAFNINEITYITSKTNESYDAQPQVTTKIMLGNANYIETGLSLIQLYQIIYKIPSPMIDILPPACLNPLGCD